MDLIKKIIIDTITLVIFLQLCIISEATLTANTTSTQRNIVFNQTFNEEFLGDNEFNAGISKGENPKKIKQNDELLQTENQIESFTDVETVTAKHSDSENGTVITNIIRSKEGLDNHKLQNTDSIDDFDKFTYAKFHNNNHVYELANDPSYKKYMDTYIDFQANTHRTPLYDHSRDSKDKESQNLDRYRYGQTIENEQLRNVNITYANERSHNTTLENNVDNADPSKRNDNTENTKTVLNNVTPNQGLSVEKRTNEISTSKEGDSVSDRGLNKYVKGEINTLLNEQTDMPPKSNGTPPMADQPLNQGKNEIQGIGPENIGTERLTPSARNVVHFADSINDEKPIISANDVITDSVLEIAPPRFTSKPPSGLKASTSDVMQHKLLSDDDFTDVKHLDHTGLNNSFETSEVMNHVTTGDSILTKPSEFKVKNYEKSNITDTEFDNKTNGNVEAEGATDFAPTTSIELKLDGMGTTEIDITTQGSHTEATTDITNSYNSSSSKLTTLSYNSDTSPLDLISTELYSSTLLPTTQDTFVETVTPSDTPSETTTDSVTQSSTSSETTTVANYSTEEDKNEVTSVTDLGEPSSSTEYTVTSTIASKMTTLTHYTDITITNKEMLEDTLPYSTTTTQYFSNTDNAKSSTTRTAKQSNINQKTTPEDTSTLLPTSTPQAEIYRTEHSGTDEMGSTTTDISNTEEESASTQSPDISEVNKSTVIAIAVSSVSCICLVLLAALLFIMKRRRKRFSYLQRCTPVGLDDYSVDNLSVYNSLRKGNQRKSKTSYGNPAFDDSSCISNPLGFPKLMKFVENTDEINAEFEVVPQITAKSTELPEGCDSKNRYANVIPLPETRVHLALVDDQPNSDYMNANYVRGVKNKCKFYIATQAPLENTVDDFWRMIWEQQSKLVLMITHLYESGVEKCVDYLPPSEVLDCHRLFGDFQVTLKKRDVKDKYIVSSLQLKNMVTDSKRDLTHIWYLGWPEKGVPQEANSIIAFLIEARSYVRSSTSGKEVMNGNAIGGSSDDDEHVPPIVVHCSPGTGRTGTVIACDIAIRYFESISMVDIPKIVYRIRRDRANCVLTKEQYAFIYKVVSLYAGKLNGNSLDSL